MQTMTRALGPKSRRSPATQFLKPFRQALDKLAKATRRANNSPSRRTGEALQLAAARLSAAAQQLGVPECALAIS